MSQSAKVPEIERLVDQLEREHDGDPWHGSPLRGILHGVTAEQAATMVIPGAHTIWELVLHITAWKGEVRRRLIGAPAAEPLEGDWPAVGATTTERWMQALERLEQTHGTLVSAVREMEESRLYAASTDTRDRPTGSGVSYYVLLHGIVQHDVYHSGQIALLKKGL
ncbi:MAG: DinB family protein [Acidobacteria bacterium]|nr:DinB family protein [Acidobacteriota bacterium]